MNIDEVYSIFLNKNPTKIYVSRTFPDEIDVLLDKDVRSKRFVSGVVDDSSYKEYVTELGSVVIRKTPKERQEIKALVIQESREIIELILQRFSTKNGKPMENSFHFGPNEIDKLLKIILFIRFGNIEGTEKIHIFEDDQSFRALLDRDVFVNIFMNDPEFIKIVANSNVTSKDIKAIGYRKKQLEIFTNYLADSNINELVWQSFFEDNQWIFGYGLSVIATSGLKKEKLEQYVSGFNFMHSGKIADALLKTRGALSSLCLVEIKTPDTPLLKSSTYRADTWMASNDLAGGIAQAQQTVHALNQEIHDRVELNDECGYSTGEIVHSYLPKSYLVIGNLGQFEKEGQINSNKFRSFELLRRNIISPEIITFDELFERAKFIVETDSFYEDLDNSEDDDIPF